MTALESIFYAIARGVARAWFEVRAVYESASRELPPDDAQIARTARIRDAIRRMPEADRPPGYKPSPPVGGGR